MTVVHEPVTITVRPVAGHIGADISGADIAGPLAPETVRQLKDALHRYKVIFFRDQRLDHASQIAFGRQFGTLTYAHPHDEAPPDGYAEIFTVDPRRYDQRYGQDYRNLVRRRQYSYWPGPGTTPRTSPWPRSPGRRTVGRGTIYRALQQTP